MVGRGTIRLSGHRDVERTATRRYSPVAPSMDSRIKSA